VGGQDGVVWLYNRCGDLWSWVDSKLQLGLLAIVYRQLFHEQGGESRSGTTTKGVEDQETLQTSALISEFSDAVQDQVHDFLTNGVVTTCIIVRGILLASDQLFWVEQLAVGASADLIWRTNY
jgi:hypothetical protein